jgi:hypothetical protein
MNTKSDPATSADTLDRLADSWDWRAREDVARNPLTPIRTLERLSCDPFHSISKLATSNMTGRIIADLSDLERKWLLSSQWGSGKDLAAKGLTELVNGNVIMTPLGLAVQDILTQSPESGMPPADEG